MKEQVRTMDHFAGLFGNRRSEPVVAVSERTDTDSGEHVEILATLRVVDSYSLPAHQNDRRAPVGLHNVL
jgi:hypothetical protein